MLEIAYAAQTIGNCGTIRVSLYSCGPQFLHLFIGILKTIQVDDDDSGGTIRMNQTKSYYSVCLRVLVLMLFFYYKIGCDRSCLSGL